MLEQQDLGRAQILLEAESRVHQISL